MPLIKLPFAEKFSIVGGVIEKKGENSGETEKEWGELDTLPNRLTFFRILLIPIVLGTLFLIKMDFPWSRANAILLGYIAGWTFAGAAITDFFDGFIARRRKIVSSFGSFLDPIADKFLVISSLILLQSMDRVPVIITIILVLRELYITSLRLLASERNETIKVGMMGKWKTACQMTAIPFLMAYDTFLGISMPLLGTVLIYATTILALYSALTYSLGLINKIKSKRKGLSS